MLIHHPVVQKAVLRLALLQALLVVVAAPVCAQSLSSHVVQQVDEAQRVPLLGNTPSVATDARFDRGAVADGMPLEHMRLVLSRGEASEAALRARIDAMHNPHSALYHQWLTAAQLGAQYGVAPQDRATVTHWLESHGFKINADYQNGYVLDFSGTAGEVRQAFHTELHHLALPNGEAHVSNMSDPEIPAALAPVVSGVASLHDFRQRPHTRSVGPVSFDQTSQRWRPRFDVKSGAQTFYTVGPYDFATIYNLLPLWARGVTGKGVTIAVIEDTNLAHPSDWSTFRKTFGLTGFTGGRFEQVYPQAKGDPTCSNPGQNGDEIEAALDAEWASASAPDAHVLLAACANTQTGSGLDTAVLNLLDTNPPEIISDSYGLCETITGAAEVALENLEEEQAAAEGVTFFIAQGDTGADECAPAEPTAYASLGINSGDNTASAFVVDVGGTDFMAQYNQDAHGVPLSRYWSATNAPRTLRSALSYIPEIPWNDSCASQLIYSDPVNGGFKEAYGPSGFCNSALGQSQFLNDIAGSGGPSTCFTGKPSIPGVVSGGCKGNPKPYWQAGVPGVPKDGVRDQPDLSLFAGNGVWGSFYVECLSDVAQGGTNCTATNDAILLGGGGTSFGAPAMAGIQALIDQHYGRQGNANYVYYALAARQTHDLPASACTASNTDGTLPNKSCVFHDVNRGDMDTPCGRDSLGMLHDCYGAQGDLLGELSTSSSQPRPAYPAHAGYDLATGLGSVDATNLFDAWQAWWP